MASMHVYQNNYMLLAIFLLLGVLLPLLVLFLGRLLRPRKSTEDKTATYAGGVDAASDVHIRFHIQYALYALVFVIFTIQTVLLYPWAVAYGKLGWFALVEMAIFTLLLLLGLAYAWKKKVLEWE